MTVAPTSTTEVTPEQLRLLNATDPAGSRSPRSRRRRQRLPGPQASIWLDARTREIGQSGIAEARRRLAEINLPTAPLIQAS